MHPGWATRVRAAYDPQGVFLLEPIAAAALALTPGWTQERLVSALGETGGSFALSHTDGEGPVASTTLNDCAVTFAGLRPSAPPPVRELRETLLAARDSPTTGTSPCSTGAGAAARRSTWSTSTPPGRCCAESRSPSVGAPRPSWAWSRARLCGPSAIACGSWCEASPSP